MLRAVEKGEDIPRPNLVIKGMSKSFGGVQALSNIDLTVNHGEIHGLLGQNGSGKSTLIKILSGFHEPDGEGSVELGGRQLKLPILPNESAAHGISIVHQSLGLVQSLSVTENLFVDRLVRKSNWSIGWSKARQDARNLLRKYQLDIHPDARVSDIPPVERALLSIVRAFHELGDIDKSEGKLLILDEPTPFLSAADVKRLFSLVRTVAERGVSVIFVSHDIDEVKELTHRATVLRNGKVAATLETATSSRREFIKAIVGRDVEFEQRVSIQHSGTAAVKIEGMTSQGLAPFDLTAMRGEVIGLTGLLGSGYDKVPYLLYGAHTAKGGVLTLHGRRVPLASQTTANAIKQRIVLIPADRQKEGIVSDFSIAENLALPVLGKNTSSWFVRRSGIEKNALPLVRDYDIRPANSSLPLKALSGGNQQKVVLAKWLQTNPELILLDEPTQGVDIGARDQIFRMISQAARAGACVLCASSDHEQLAAICDRVLVFARGRVVAELSLDQVTKEQITESCFTSLEPEFSN
ncbi:sugar ABC transporter ATP-binding protein [Mesorhizobium sp. WSM4976]|jgi:ribose transport system ATP-binding protein|uniref:sugar ABC transporter ATP-binding protein n=1 Tax=Mesorhizobium sp. WSM4976 TaxID=3038549 RepID=UPI0024159DA1|nr:sugar ABC transporter ATP-binding protein [Mesorhizobium sp. WSM4976]MDG4892421.1 sugar ABC transporter ATP-binding protein [Mesorhizobium sp. WSM4976]